MLDTVREFPVIVVGGGASGLSAAAALSRQGIDAVVLEQDPELGGTWARRYDRLHLHTVRQFSGLAHFPIPRRYPAYLSRDDVVEYLREYARHFGLRVVTCATVRRIRPRDCVVRTMDRRDRRRGCLARPRGRDRDGAVSAADSSRVAGARELTEDGSRTRRPTPTRRPTSASACSSSAPATAERRSRPISATTARRLWRSASGPRRRSCRAIRLACRCSAPAFCLSALPAAIANRLGKLTARLVLGDLTRYGMPKGEFAPYTTKRIPLIDVGFVEALKRGRVKVRPALERLTQTGAVFADGTSEPFDAIIAATGFTTGLESLVDIPGVLDDRGEPRGASGEPTAHPGLYFIGFTHSLRGHLFEANRASRRLARNVRRYLKS